MPGAVGSTKTAHPRRLHRGPPNPRLCCVGWSGPYLPMADCGFSGFLADSGRGEGESTGVHVGYDRVPGHRTRARPRQGGPRTEWKDTAESETSQAGISGTAGWPPRSGLSRRPHFWVRKDQLPSASGGETAEGQAQGGGLSWGRKSLPTVVSSPALAVCKQRGRKEWWGVSRPAPWMKGGTGS